MLIDRKAIETYNGIVWCDLLEDRREYDVDLLQRSYELTKEQAELLYDLVQSNFTV